MPVIQPHIAQPVGIVKILPSLLVFPLLFFIFCPLITFLFSFMQDSDLDDKVMELAREVRSKVDIYEQTSNIRINCRHIYKDTDVEIAPDAIII